MKTMKLMLIGVIFMAFGFSQGGAPTQVDMQGPPPCDEVDTNGDGSIDRDEAREKFGNDPQGNPDPNFDQKYDEVDTNGDGVVDCAELDAAPDNNDGGKPQEGDTCGECGYVHTGDPNEDHHHCDHCGSAVNSGEEMQNHMEADHSDMMEQHDDGGDGNHDGGPAPSNHWDGNCGAMMNGESEYWLDSDGDGSPEDGPYAVWSEDADGNSVDCGPGDPGAEGDQN